MEKEKTPKELHERRQCFILKAIQEGAHEKKPRYMSEAGWEKHVNIGVSYNFGEDALEDIAREYGQTRQEGSRSNRAFLKNLWDNSSIELRSQYLPSDLLARKPLSQKLQERSSQAHGGVSLKVREQVLLGITDIESICRITGVSKHSLVDVRATLKRWGIIFPKRGELKTSCNNHFND